jgi:hypothetical protein
MAAPSVTYTFSNSTTADATQVNTNFTDLVNSLSDGLKDLTISSLNTATLTVSGAATFNGTVALGNATTDDVTITGYIASDILPKTTGTASLGSATQAWEDIYLDEGATNGGTIYFDAGTTKYLQSDATGATLTIGGFTTLSTANNIAITGASSNLLLGTATEYTIAALSHDIQINSNGGGRGMSITTWDNATPRLTFSSSRSSSVGTWTANQTGDTLGIVQFVPNDGSTPTNGKGADIRGVAAATISGSNYGTYLEFYVNPANSGGKFKALTINTSQSVVPEYLLDLSTSTAGQIKFPATQNASADANTLDDYEEGTWVPSISFVGGTTGITYGSRVGRYVKIGRVVTAQGYVALTSKGSSTGAARLTSLPFTSANVGSAFSAVNISYYNAFFATRTIRIFPERPAFL